MQEAPNKALPDFTKEQLETFTKMKAELYSRPVQCPQEVWDSLVLPTLTKVETAGFKMRQQLLERVEAAVMPEDNKGAVSAMVPLALSTLVDIITNPSTKAADKLHASTYVIDHDIGKASQHVEHSGSLALTIMRQADAHLKAQRLKDVTTPPLEMDKIDKLADDLVREYRPHELTVGRKGAEHVEEDI